MPWHAELMRYKHVHVQRDGLHATKSDPAKSLAALVSVAQLPQLTQTQLPDQR